MKNFLTTILILFQFNLNAKGYNAHDSLAQSKDKKYNQGIILNLYWPAFPSSIGYFMKWQFKPKVSFETDFSFCTAPAMFNGSWNYGLSFQQFLLFGEKVKPKIGLYEFLCVNPQKITGRFDNYTYSDRPSSFLTSIGITTGVDIPLIKNRFYLSPLIAGGIVLGTRDYSSKKNTFNIDNYHTSWLWSFGLNFKIKF